MADIDLVLFLISAVVVLTAVSRRLGASTPIVMVLGGLLLTFVPGAPSLALPPDLVFFGFLPPLVFAGGYSTSIRDFKKNLRPIVLLAFGLVIFTAGVVAAVAHALAPTLGWAGAFALGAIVSPPDEIAALAVFERLGVPKRIVSILEGESLLNDATALVIYRFAIAAAAAGAFSLFDASFVFVYAILGGIAVGTVAGYAFDRFISRATDTPIVVAMTLVAPYVCYIAAESLGVSGIIATVVGGLWGRHVNRHFQSDTRVVSSAVWQIWLFLLNGIVFFLLGLQLPQVVRAVALDSGVVTAALLIVAAVVVTRFVWVFPATYLPRLIPAVKRVDPNPPWQAVIVVAWSGLRGVVSLAAALALPSSFPGRDLILLFTFVVILVTLVGQGLTLPFLIRLLGLSPEGDGGQNEAKARALTAEAALARLDDLETEWPTHKPLMATLRSQYEHRASHAEILNTSEAGAAEQELLEHTQIRRELIEAERQKAFELHERGVIDDDLLRAIERDLDLEEIRTEG